MANPNLTCFQCFQPFEGTSAITAFGRQYHPDCFRCKHCKLKIFSFAKFYEEEGDPVCAKCFGSAGPSCGKCKKPIAGKHVKAHGREWHEDCYRCSGCKKIIGAEGGFEDEGNLWHLECFR